MNWIKKILAAFLAALKVKPAPVPPPLPAVIPPDDLSPSAIIWDEPAGDVGAWLCSVTMVGGRVTRDGMRVDRFLGVEKWPVITNAYNPKQSIGNWWIIAKADDGAWHGATVDWLGKGKLACVDKHWIAGSDGLHGALARWTAQRGEVVYMMVSTPARAGVQTIRERSQIVRSAMP